MISLKPTSSAIAMENWGQVLHKKYKCQMLAISIVIYLCIFYFYMLYLTTWVLIICILAGLDIINKQIYFLWNYQKVGMPCGWSDKEVTLHWNLTYSYNGIKHGDTCLTATSWFSWYLQILVVVYVILFVSRIIYFHPIYTNSVFKLCSF